MSSYRVLVTGSRKRQGYCKSAGMRRNAKMVKLGADICIAFIKNASPGATAAAKMAERAGIHTERIELS